MRRDFTTKLESFIQTSLSTLPIGSISSFSTAAYLRSLFTILKRYIKLFKSFFSHFLSTIELVFLDVDVHSYFFAKITHVYKGILTYSRRYRKLL